MICEGEFPKNDLWRRTFEGLLITEKLIRDDLIHID